HAGAARHLAGPGLGGGKQGFRGGHRLPEGRAASAQVQARHRHLHRDDAARAVHAHPRIDRADDGRGRHARRRRAAHRRGLRGDQLENRVRHGLPHSSGAAAWIAGHTIERLPEGLPVVLLEAALAILTTLFSLVIGHVGATIVMVPMGINLALAAGGNPTAFALLVAMSASNNFMTASNPVMSMITGPAGYQPRDLWRLGAPLSLLYTVVVIIAVNIMY